MAEFDGKVALVTGGASGIGAATVAMFLERGAAVASVDLNAGASPDGALKVDGDVTDSRSVADAVARAEGELGPLDAVVCCAGTAGDSLRTVDVSDDEWRRVFALNCDGVFYFNREAARVMVPRGRGRIVNIASIAGKEGNPMARLGQPVEVAELVAFLASERMTFSTGATFDISGGRAVF